MADTVENKGESYFAKIGRNGGKKSGIARNEQRKIQTLAVSVLDTKFKPNQNLKKALKGIGIDTNDKISLLNGILAVFSGKALSGDIVAARFVFDIAGYTMYAQEKKAKIKLLQRMAEQGAPEEQDSMRPKADLIEIDKEARKLGIYAD